MSVLKALVAVASAALLAGCATPSAPGSAACAPRPLARLPVTFRSGVPTVGAGLDNHPVTMVLDLGAQGTVLADAVAERLGLSRDPSDLPTISGIGGDGTHWAATARELTLGGLTLHDKRLETAQILMGGGQHPIDGAIGLDVLLKYDVDWDLPHHLVTLNAPSGCEGPPAGWARPATPVTIQHPGGFATEGKMPRPLQLPVLVDGRPMTALLDSGASVSVIGAATAARLEAPGQAGDLGVHLSGVGADTRNGFVHSFRSVTVAGDALPGWKMVVAPLPLGIGDMILGVGFLRLHRAWMPAGGERAWFSPRETPASVTAAGETR